MKMQINALIMEEAEHMLKVLEKQVCHYYNVYGVKRITSFGARSTGKAQIQVMIEEAMWEYVKEIVMSEIVNTLNKAVTYEVIAGIIDFSIEEATL